MKNISTNCTVTITEEIFEYMEGCVTDYTADSVIEQALEGTPESDREEVYYTFIVCEYLRNAIMGTCFDPNDCEVF